MARRPTNPTPPALVNRITSNSGSGLYDITENGITYSMPLEMTRHLKDYYWHFPAGHKAHFPTMSRWYSDLNKDQRKQVKRTGNIPPAPTDFYPDQEYD